MTKFTSTPAKSAKLPSGPELQQNPTADMEFLIPQLPVSANGRTNMLLKGGGVSSSSSTTSMSSSTSSGKARKNATNGSILQSALNSLNSRQSGVNVAVIQAHQSNQRYSQPTSGYNYSTSADGISTPKMRPYHKQSSVSHVSAALSTMGLQQQTSVSSHSTSSTSSLGSTASLPPASAVSGSASSMLLMPPPVQPSGTKMTKKQLKLAQAQLDKLTQINIHLHGMFR